ncbi:MAG: glyoxalase/bleomycin resistance/dioxygenase family protein [Alphaproteobacteria bacterium]|nr:glyoxalase/bleomycin resistance/dioxygenase family protein [Alphaproteobacteria bacterium]OJU58179.1 MAG: glyoxalase/bleomycin resistance/dioxygenase family protein [Alphaproteobacteria bacterium 62-8]
MKRFHVHVSVENLTESIRFYSTLFAIEPTIVKPDYAKWMLDDPRVNFAISKRGHAAGVEHLGIQAENEDELAEIYGRLEQAERPVIEETATVCCYAQSDKQWIADPQGVAWETFLTHGESTVYGQERATALAGAGCCEPASMTKELAPVAASCGCGPKADVCCEPRS